MSETQTYEGSCHCEKVKFSVEMAPPEKAFACNCSICSRAGWLLGFVPEAQFSLLAGENELTDYQFGKRHIHHLFCKSCGVRSFSRGKDKQGKGVVSLNLRCLAGVDAMSLPVQQFDGAAL
jgi:hypothetical protein